MKKTKKIYMVTARAGLSLKELKQDVFDWVSFLRIVAIPESYRFGDEEVRAFDLQIITHQIQQLTEKENLWIKVNAQDGEFQLHVSKLTLHERTILDGAVFLANQAMIENYCDTRMVKNGVYGYIRSFDEYLYNNVEIIGKRTFESSDEIKQLPKRYDREKTVIVDCNQLAGYDIYFKGLCLTSCWKMYYSSLYTQVIPKSIFMEVQQVQAVEELRNQVVKITLFSNPFNWDVPVNQKYQRLFRDQMGYDQLAWNNGTGVLRPPFIEYAFVEEVIQTVQYQNSYYQPVEKKNATYFVTRSYDKIRQKYVVNRTKGILNAQAYFPWIDEKSRKMMNYRVLDPKMAIDDGLSAYEFYIRQFLEIEVLDEKYDEFVSVLRFYLPKEAIQQLPLEALWDKLFDVNISNLKQKESSTRFDLEKAKNHLRVVFLDSSYLETINQTIDISE
ncbi:hypothetical protein [Enterococcus caccae]|uniref:Uncharacterized protein n=1 Tax=Enterococcus caccae ATCC BAA-1240 TaxID=1158612 RepID=R3WM36_9ENTE|nr:hypothetical protein [Enterococcus caccae]EOL42915.1 hypothetical protein UC7_03126 [Enterococcus caccae ATCC BAA-1240]EOT67804.1 hypothetical protein I580_00186 [Enterococcus caccae ATCC BAA-1240]